MVGARFEASLPGQVILHPLLVERDALFFVANDATQSPGQERYLLGQRHLKVTFRREALQHAFAMLFPIFFSLYARDHRSGGAEAMFCGVPANHLLAFLGCRSSLAHVHTSFTGRINHATPPFTRTCSIVSSPACSQPLRASRNAVGSLSELAECI